MSMLAYRRPEWMVYTPPGWLAWFVESVSPTSPGARWWVLAAGAGAVAALWWAALWALARSYAKMQPVGRERAIVMAPLRRPGSLAGRLGRLVTRSKSELAALWLCSTMLRRDQDLRMRSWPTLGIVLGPLLLGWGFGQLADPLTASGYAGLLPVVCVYLVAVPVPTIMNNMNFSRDHTSSWVLWSSPIRERGAVAEGVRKAITYRILLPVLICMWAVFAWLWRDPLSIAMHATASWLVVLAAGYVSKATVLRGFPLSCAPARGETIGSVAMYTAAVSGSAMLLAAIHFHLARTPAYLAAYLVALGALTVALKWLAERSLRRRTAEGYEP
jgi:hypothetical protein